MRDNAATLRLCGVAGLVGASLLLAADWTLLGTFTSGSEFRENWHVLLSEMPRWRLTVGGLAGPVGAWFYVVGFWQLYLALKPAGRPLAFGVFAGFSMSFVWVAGAFHTSFPFLAEASRMRGAATGDETTVVRAAVEGMFAYAGWLYYVGLAPALVGVVLLAYAVVRKRTRYPRWFAALNPALLYLLSILFQWLPAPLGGLLVIGAGNLVFLLFFAVSTALLWNGGKFEGSEAGPPMTLVTSQRGPL
jgi:hypothetical protein